MDGFVASNWFSIFTVLCLIASSGVHYGISKQRNAQTAKTVDELKQTMKSEVHDLKLDIEQKVEEVSAGIKTNAAMIQGHMSNADIHVSSILLELLKTRHDFVVQQLSDTRNDIGRIEQQIVRV